MKTVWTLTLLLLACPMYAQDASGVARVYKDQFVQLHSRTTSILHRVEELMRGDPTDRAILNLEEETSALHQLINHLGEDTLRSNLDELKKGHSPNKTFLFVSSGCTEMGFVLEALDNFMDTKDRAFLGFAKRGEDITGAVQEIL
ncbi:MAG TPA: hypothetical protein VN310_15450 [Candidatus Dormibacteraeota bacterium]|nr:hypothetical protein [Candidatus Dormibacteraeota bacterium]